MLVQYLPWMFVPMLAGLLALWRRPVGFAAHRIAYNGYVLAVRKQARATYTACRCVKLP